MAAFGTLARCAQYERYDRSEPQGSLWRPAAASQPVSLVEVVIRRKRSVPYQLAIGGLAFVALVTSVKLSRPVFLGRAPVGEQLAAHAYVDPTAHRAPWMDSPAEVSLKTPQFLLDRELFTMDLLRTGKVTQTRARSLADIAVREAYTRQVPPALVLGVMLTENDELKSSARSNVGAIGLMQVYPKHWRDALGRKFGTNVHTDSTNLKYGIFILGWVVGRAADREDDRDAAWRRALLGYNGCVRGTNTKNCGSYPDVVRREVQRSAKSTCRGEDFNACVVAPMWLARRDAERPDTVAPQVR